MLLDRERFQCEGALLLEGALVADETKTYRQFLGAMVRGAGQRLANPPPGLLNMIMAPGGLCSIASKLEGEPLRPVRLLVFDKSESVNWAVDWHQDRVLPLATEHTRPGFERWTNKSGVPHVEPPLSLSERMVTLRVHLDDSGQTNAPLKTLRGSHTLGRLPIEAVAREAQRRHPAVHIARTGDVLALKTLVVHASERAKEPLRRRVLHIDFAPPDALPEGLDWSFSLPDY